MASPSLDCLPSSNSLTFAMAPTTHPKEPQARPCPHPASSVEDRPARSPLSPFPSVRDSISCTVGSALHLEVHQNMTRGARMLRPAERNELALDDDMSFCDCDFQLTFTNLFRRILPHGNAIGESVSFSWCSWWRSTMPLTVSPAICEGDSFRTKRSQTNEPRHCFPASRPLKLLKSRSTSRSLRIIALYAGGQIDFKYESDLPAT